MPRQCPDCWEIYPDFVDFCVADGARLLPRVTRVPEEDTDQSEELTSEYHSAPEVDTEPVPVGPGELALLHPQDTGDADAGPIVCRGNVLVGRFEPKTGAVDVDLSNHEDAESIEPRHARLRFLDGQWSIEDLSSKAGVSINRGPRITESTRIESGDLLALGDALFVFETPAAERPLSSGADDERR